MINITDSSKCCGCSACYNACPHNAIQMKPDALGFLYPIVDKSKCIDCGLCDRVCSFNDNYDTSNNLVLPEAYAVRHKNPLEIETSRSGAAFIAISDWILLHNGVVYGVGFDEHFNVIHKRASTKEERNEFKGSKYVQSNLGNIFKKVKEDLKNGLNVLFSGTPCQTAGLKSFIDEKLSRNLYLVDIVCHGVPSPSIWSDYLAFLEKKEQSKIQGVNFRDKKTFGWRAHRETFDYAQGCKSETMFTSLFYKHIMFRHSCEFCHFCNIKRPSDITLADFWGWENVVPDFNKDDKGVSLVLCNTSKGIELFNRSNDALHFTSVEIKDCLQPNLKNPSRMHPLRNSFERDYKKYGFSNTIKKYGFMGGWQAVRFRVISFILRGVRFVSNYI